MAQPSLGQQAFSAVDRIAALGFLSNALDGMAMVHIRVLGISGSLRKGSYNTSLLRAASELLPEDMTLETFDLSPIPLYNEDVRALGFPELCENLENASPMLMLYCLLRLNTTIQFQAF